MRKEKKKSNPAWLSREHRNGAVSVLVAVVVQPESTLSAVTVMSISATFVSD